MPLIWPLRVHLSLENPTDRQIYEYLQTIPKGQRANYIRQVLAAACTGETAASITEFSTPPPAVPTQTRTTLTF
jgi:hypothetical protein